MFTDAIQARGQVSLVLKDNSGCVVQNVEVKNLVVTVGKGVLADRMKSSPTKNAMSHMAVGTDATAAAVSDTALGAEVGSSRTALSSTGVSSNVITYACTFNAGVGTGALTEAGIFNASSSGDMLARTVFSTINKGASDVLTITWTVTLS